MKDKTATAGKRFPIFLVLFAVASAGALLAIFIYMKGDAGLGAQAQQELYTSTTFAMDTIVTQSAYGPNAQRAMEQVNLALAEYEDRLSLYSQDGDIARVNAAAGDGGVEVSPETAALLQQAVNLSAQSEGAFAITVAPLTLAWGVTGDNPRVVPQSEINTLLPLVNDSTVQIVGNHVTLPQQDMGIDLGGIAKGAACSLAAAIYDEYGVDSALLSIGGNIYARGTKPDGTPWKVGFRDPENGQNTSIASFPLTDKVIAVSGGYERYFEEDGEKYIHIMDPRTGKPAKSDIISVGVINEDGAEADFYSTTLFVWGKERALQYMREGGTAILLDDNGTLYVSESLREGFTLHEDAGVYQLEFVPGG